MARAIKRKHGGVEALINNAGIASMNHAVLTPASTVNQILQTNVVGTFLFCREMAKLMRRVKNGRIVNFTTVAHPLNLEGESVYAASKAAVESLTRVLARELSEFGITVNAVGPTPIETDLIRGVPQAKMDALIERQALNRMGEVRDVINAVDFFLQEGSDFITGQVLYLGGVN
jgi:3-oxoacyl-[acyl-carrier protein] reductase